MKQMRKPGRSCFVQLKKETVHASEGFGPSGNLREEMLQRLGVEGIRLMSHDYENEQRYSEIVAGSKTHVSECFDTGGDFAGAPGLSGRLTL